MTTTSPAGTPAGQAGSRLLPEADVFVTNGGFGGTQQALAADVPAVVALETEDKTANAARVAYHRLGINLQTATPTPQAVVTAVSSLRKDSEMRENVLRLAKVYAQHDPLDAIERLLLGNQDAQVHEVDL